MATPRSTVTLHELLTVLDAAVLRLLEAPAGAETRIGSIVLVEEADLAAPGGAADLVLLVGVSDVAALRWLAALSQAGSPLPVAVMTRTGGPGSALADAARAAGVAVLQMHPQARWDHVLGLIERTLDRSRGADTQASDTDLFELAQLVAANTGGLVSIEDEQSRVLSYSASDETADELRRLSILGREGPPDYLRTLQEWGVFDRLRRSEEVVDVPAHPELGIKRRLVVAIRDPARGGPSTDPRVLGTIWVQLGATDFNPEAVDVLRGAAAIAGRVIARSRNAPSTEEMLIQRLFGARGGGVDVPSLAGALNLPTDGPAAVLGFALQPDATSPADLATFANTLRLHASSFRRDCLTSVLGERVYLLLPRYRSAEALAAWATQLVEQVERRHGLVARAAIAVPVPDLGQVATARAEVDRVLDGTAAGFPRGRVTTLAQSRTAVLLAEILDLVRERPALRDPRVGALADHDRQQGTALVASVAAYLREHGDIARAAAQITVHPNTLRYRLRRIEAVLGMDLDDPADRLLLEVQLACLPHHSFPDI